ncbi:MAG: hypothetical protein O2822_00435 [Chloroflexi bacterium]|nr:hypothetical protein [Chloroflexota bacterium]
MAQEMHINPRTVVLSYPECGFLWSLGAKTWPNDVFLLLNLGARCTTYVRELLRRARSEGGAQEILWIRHLGCTGVQSDEAAAGEIPPGSATGQAPAPSVLAQEFERELGDLADRGVFNGYRVIRAALWDDALSELRVVHTRVLHTSGEAPVLDQSERGP